MTIRTTVLGLLAASAFVTPALSQSTDTPATGAGDPTKQAQGTSDIPGMNGSSTLPAPGPNAIPAPAGDTASLQAQLQALQSQVDALKKQINQVQPSWKGAPQFADGSGFTFKPKGFVQFDSGYIERSIDNRSFQKFGWANRARRLVIGAEGTLPGGFGYNAEFNLAQGTVDYEDIFLSYQKKGSPFLIRAGNTYPLSSLESMSSSRVLSFLERASFVDAFSENRRLGIAAGLVDPKDRYTLTVGAYGQEINNANDGDTRTGWQASVRGTFSPTFGNTRLHLGATFQHRVFQQDAQGLQYRSRPFTQITGQRLIDTGNIAAKGDDILGGEVAAIHGPLHVVAEVQKDWVRGYEPGHVFSRNNGAVAGSVFYVGDPDFLSAYGEAGFYITGETRGYKGGRWDRTKVLHPFNEGGIGAIQVNGRVDYVRLNSRVGNGANLVANNYFVNGGDQLGFEGSVIWSPIDYVRFYAQFAHTEITGGPQTYTGTPALKNWNPLKRIDDRKYSNNSLALRAQLDF